ncbi:hypothetical protein ACLB1M_00185 [Escherichia coli]
MKGNRRILVQSQKNAESAAGSAQEAGQYAVEAAQARDNTQTLADAVQKNAEVVAEQRQQVNLLAAEMAENAGQVQQDKQDTERLLEQAQRQPVSLQPVPWSRGRMPAKLHSHGR